MVTQADFEASRNVIFRGELRADWMNSRQRIVVWGHHPPYAVSSNMPLLIVRLTSSLQELPLNSGTVYSDTDSVRVGSGKIIQEVFFHSAFNHPSEFAGYHKTNSEHFFPGSHVLGGLDPKALACQVPIVS